MTRINLVDPSELYDQHVMAEYRELPMVGSALQRSLRSKNWQTTYKNLPKTFTLNKGHVSFFYDKGFYLHNRYLLLIEELHKRGYKLDPTRIFKREQWPDYLYNDWQPSEIDKNVVRERIALRVSQKPSFYTKTNSETCNLTLF